MDASKRRRLLFLSPDIVRAVDSPAALLERMEPALASSTVVSLRTTLDRQGAGAAIARLLGALSNASDPIVYDTFLDALRSLGHAPLAEKLDTNASTLTPTPSSSSMKRSVCSSSSDEISLKERRSHSDVTPPPSRFGIAATSPLPRSPSEPIGFGRPLVVGGGLRLGRSESAAGKGKECERRKWEERAVLSGRRFFCLVVVLCCFTRDHVSGPCRANGLRLGGGFYEKRGHFRDYLAC